MTYPARCSSPPPSQRLGGAARRQRGSMLIEAMVGVVVSASLGLGMSYGAARALAVQRNASTQNMAVLQMRGLLAAPTDLSVWCAKARPSRAVKILPSCLTPYLAAIC